MAGMRYLAAFGILLGASLLGACGGPPQSPRQQIEAWVDTVQQAAEDRDAGAIAKQLAPDYADAREHDRDALERFLRLYFLRERHVEVVTHLRNIDFPYQDMARIKVDVLIAGRHAGGSILNLGAGRYTVQVELKLLDGKWLATWADWHRSDE